MSEERSTEESEWPAQDLTEEEWMQVVANGLHDELSDPREDIYTLEGGKPDGVRALRCTAIRYGFSA